MQASIQTHIAIGSLLPNAAVRSPLEAAHLGGNPDLLCAEPVQAPAASRARRAPAAGAGKIRSLADLNREEDESDDDNTNEYYAGGEKSGQVSLEAAHKCTTPVPPQHCPCRSCNDATASMSGDDRQVHAGQAVGLLRQTGITGISGGSEVGDWRRW